MSLEWRVRCRGCIENRKWVKQPLCVITEGPHNKSQFGWKNKNNMTVSGEFSPIRIRGCIVMCIYTSTWGDKEQFNTIRINGKKRAVLRSPFSKPVNTSFAKAHDTVLYSQHMHTRLHIQPFHYMFSCWILNIRILTTFLQPSLGYCTLNNNT